MALWTTGRWWALGAVVTTVGLMFESRVDLLVRLVSLLALGSGSAVTLYVVVVTGPAEPTEETLLRGLGITSRRPAGIICIWCSWTGDA